MTTDEQLKTYSSVVWNPDDLIEVRPMPGNLGKRVWIPAGDIPKHVKRLVSENASGANITAGVLPRKAAGRGKDEDCAAGSVIWADLDGVAPADAWDTVRASMPEPTMLVNSGHGSHVYWRLRDRQGPTEISRLVGDVAAFIGSDPSVKNPSRVMRLPGFLNLKPPKARVELVRANPKARYNFAELRGIVPSVKPGRAQSNAMQASRPSGGQPRDALIERARRYVATIPGSGPGGRTKTGFKVAAALVNDFGLGEADALPILAGWDSVANSPTIATDYGPDELRSILRNAARYAKKSQGSKVEPGRRAQRGLRAVIEVPSQRLQVSGCSELLREFEAEGRGERKTIPLPWPRLSGMTNALRPGSVCIVGGPAGHGKSLFAMAVAVCIHGRGVSWAFLPLEDRRLDFQRRLLAHLAGDWRAIDDSPETAEYRKQLLAAHQDELAQLAASVCENPRLPVAQEDGRHVVPALPYQAILDWADQALKTARVIFIDPWTQIDFGDRDPWKGEKDFMRRLVGQVAAAGASVVLVAHTAKRSGRNGTLPLSGEDLQGAAELRRLSHTILLLDVHDPKDSDLWRAHGYRENVTHDRTIIIDKSRNAAGRGCRLAFRMDGPKFVELGTIAPRESNR